MSRFSRRTRRTARWALAGAAASVTAAHAGRAQSVSADDLGRVPIAVVVPTTTTALTVDQRNQLGNKLLQSATANGMSGMGGPAGFELVPVVTLTRDTEAGELQRFKVVSLNVALAIRQAPQNTAYASTSVVLNGTGATRDAAITGAIDNLSPDDPRVLALIETGRKRIVQYYESNCAAIRSDAKARAATGKAAEAIALLMSVPREASSCQPGAAADAERLYAVYEERQCQATVRDARADAANRDYRSAAEKLRAVDPSSACAKSADALIREIDTKVTASADRSFQMEWRAMRSERDAISQTLEAPGAIVSRRRELTKTTAFEFISGVKLPTRTHTMTPG